MTLELLELEGLEDISPQTYARRCIEARLAEVQAQRHLIDAARSMQGARRWPRRHG